MEEARKGDIDLEPVGVYDTLIMPNGRPRTNVRDVAMRDFAINRYKCGHVCRALGMCACRQYNSAVAFTRYVDKFNQLLDVRSKAFRLPLYFVGNADASQLPRILSLLGGYPFIAKALDRSMGQDVWLIANADDFSRLTAFYPAEREWLFEEYIAVSHGRDMRLMALRGEAVACMERRSAGDFRSNVALGASVKNLPVTAVMRSIAADVYDCTGLDVAGIDLLYGTDGLVFCEVNVMPGLEGIESASGLNIARMIVSMIKEDFKL